MQQTLTCHISRRQTHSTFHPRLQNRRGIDLGRAGRQEKTMEDDRAQVDLGIAADIEESQMAHATQSEHASSEDPATAVKQPRKRFVGRRAAAEAAAKNGTASANGESGAVQGSSPSHPHLSISHAVNSRLVQPPNHDARPGSSTASPGRSWTTRASTRPLRCCPQTTASRSPRRYTASAPPGPRRWPCRCPRACCSSRRPSRTS